MNHYLSLIKFSHTVFALPFALTGFFMGMMQSATPSISWSLFLKIILCMVFARSAAMAFNRWLDRDIDSINPRTQNREIPSGKIAARNALIFTILNSLAFIVTTYFINTLCFVLSPVALVVILGYSFTKRFTRYCHLVLGAGLGLAPVGAFIAVTGYFHWIPVVLGLAVFCWVAGFDIIYALQDDEFDRSHNLHSIPVSFGRKNALRIAAVLHGATMFFMALALYGAGVAYPPLNIIYIAGGIIFTALLLYQHSLVSPDDLRRVDMAFFTTNGIASVIFGSFFILDVFI